MSKELGYKFIENKDLDYLDKKVILFVGNDYWKNKIYLFNYIDKKFEFITRIPKHMNSYKMIKNKYNFCIVEVLFEDKKENFLFDTGATLIRNNKNYAISFLDGIIFDKLVKKYKVIPNYDFDGSPCIIIQKIIIFDKIIRNVKFLRRNDNNFIKWMSHLTGIKHIGAIGGNILKKFKLVADFKNELFYI